jgi:hypothetical protein
VTEGPASDDHGAPTGSSERPTGARRRFETWRKVMIAGALVLLAVTIGDAVVEGRPPRWITIPLGVTGYVLLMFGFVLAMKQRRDSAAKPSSTERRSSSDRSAGPRSDRG